MLLGLFVVVGPRRRAPPADRRAACASDRVATGPVRVAADLTAQAQNQLEQLDVHRRSTSSTRRPATSCRASSPSRARSPAAYVIMTARPATTATWCSRTCTSGALDIDVGEPASCRRPSRHPRRRQQTQMTEVDRRRREPCPAVVVGSVVEVPNAGAYELYFLYPLDQEEATLALVGNAPSPSPASSLVLLVGAVAWRRHPPGRRRRCGAPARVAERLVRGPARRADAGRAARTTSPGWRRRSTRWPTACSARSASSRTSRAVQQRFVSDVSHELRTPLTTIRMAGDVLHESRADFDPAVGAVGRAAARASSTGSRPCSPTCSRSAGSTPAPPCSTSSRSTCAAPSRRVVEAARPLAERRGSVVTVHAPDEPCRGRGRRAPGRADPAQPRSSTPSSTARAARSTSASPPTTTPSRSSSATTASACARARPAWSSTGSGGPTRRGPAPPAAPASGLSISLEDARLHGGWLQAWGEPGVGSHFRLTLPQRAGDTLHGSPLPLSPTEDP